MNQHVGYAKRTVRRTLIVIAGGIVVRWSIGATNRADDGFDSRVWVALVIAFVVSGIAVVAQANDARRRND